MKTKLPNNIHHSWLGYKTIVSYSLCQTGGQVVLLHKLNEMGWNIFVLFSTTHIYFFTDTVHFILCFIYLSFTFNE